MTISDVGSAHTKRKHLVILGCSSSKIHTSCDLPAVARYDGPAFRVLSKRVRSRGWPSDVSVGVLSARYGLIGGLAPIADYDMRMQPTRASELRDRSTETLLNWSKHHRSIRLYVGKDYLPALNLDAITSESLDCRVIEGGIGQKLGAFSSFLGGLPGSETSSEVNVRGRPLYFLPDWDDMLDVDFDFRRDRFSAPNRSSRNEVHCVELMKPNRISDGILLSLAQNRTAKGLLKRVEPTHLDSLAPRSIRTTFGLSKDQFAFGDCGAFSYSHRSTPDISVEQAISLYQLYGFDFGASVDHIPLPSVQLPNGDWQELSRSTQQRRIAITRANAEKFLSLHRAKRCSFIPVGVIQGITSRGYAKQLPEYVEMGYRYIALGGLVPRTDREIEEIVAKVFEAKAQLSARLRDLVSIHLFGVYRPKLQSAFRRLGVTSFDSATYFRKAWLRSTQNYLGTDGMWYSAIRVPMTADPRTRQRMERKDQPIAELKKLEARALKALRDFGNRRKGVESTLDAVMEYDELLLRAEGSLSELRQQYRATLESRVWEQCSCSVCSSLGIQALVFRGYNRNKRRGAHNTFQLYESLG